jgi:predicted nucleic acid-binding protein
MTRAHGDHHRCGQLQAVRPHSSNAAITASARLCRGAEPGHPLSGAMPLATSTVSLAELSAGVHSAAGTVERARRVLRVLRVEATFSPLPFDVEAARQYGIIAAKVISIGRKPRGRVADLMIESIAAANRLPLFTANPQTFTDLSPS